VLGGSLGEAHAMKMETLLKSPRDGVIGAVHTEEGAQVRTGDVLIEIAIDADQSATSEPA